MTQSTGESVQDMAQSFDSGTFVVLTLSYGIPFVVVGCACLVLFGFMHYRIDRLSSHIAVLKWRCLIKESSYKIWRWVLMISASLLFLAPLILLVTWGIVTAVCLPPPVVGVVILFLGLALYVGVWGVASWRSHNWRLTRTVVLCGATSFICLCATEITVAVSGSTFSFFGLSAIFLSFNMYPMIILAFLWAPGKRVDFTSYSNTVLKQMEAIDVHDHGTRQAVKLKASILLYCAALGVLLVYSILALLLLPGVGGAGFATMGAVVVLDVALFILHRAGQLQNPAWMCVVFTLCRGFLAGFGANYYFIGHSCVFVVFGLMLTRGIVQKWIRVSSTKDQTESALGVSASELREDVEKQKVSDAGAVKMGESKEIELTKGLSAQVGVASVDNGQAPLPLSRPRGSMASMNISRMLVGYEGVLAFLLVCFMIDFGIAVGLRDNLLTVKLTTWGSAHHQYLFGLAALALSLIAPLLLGLWRTHRASGLRRPGIRALVFAGLAELAIVLVGIVFFLLTASLVILLSCLFGPLVIICGVLSFVLWRANDFVLLRPATEREPPGTGCITAFFKGQLPKADYFLLSAWSSTGLLIVLFGITLALTNQPEYVGWTLMSILLLVVFTILPLVKWFNTFRLGAFIVVSVVVGISILVLHQVLFALLAAPRVVGVSASTITTGVVVSAIGYPWVLSVVAIVLYWRDHRWKLSRGVIVGLATQVGIILCGVIVVSVLLKPWQVGISLLVVFLAMAYLLAMSVLWIRNGYYLQRRAFYSVFGVMILLVGLGLVVGTYSVFLGFSMAMLALFLFLAGGAAVRLLRSGQASVSVYAAQVFPVFKYNPEADDVKESNVGAVLVAAALIVALLWGIAGTIFMRPPFVGFGVIGVVTITGCVLFNVIGRQQAVRFASVSAWATPEIVRRCFKQASRQQLGRGDRDVMEVEGKETDTEASDQEEEAMGPTVTELAEAIRLKEQETGGMFGNPFQREGAIELLELDRQLDVRNGEEMRCRAHFEVLTTLAAETERRRDETLFFKFLREIGQRDVTLKEIQSWSDKTREDFTLKRREWLEDVKQKEAGLKKRKMEDEEAARKRRLKLEVERAKEADEARRRHATEVGGHGKSTGKAADDGPERERKTRVTKKETGGESDREDLDPKIATVVTAVQQGEVLFEDDAFPSNDAAAGRIAEWVWPSEVAGAESPTLFKEDVDPADISQGMLGDCWFLSAISVLALQPQRLKATFVVTDESHGLSVVRFFKNGEWQDVLVDNRIPVSRNRKPVFAHCKSVDELWVALLEKAYAKIHGGYGAIEGGLVHLALVDLTGGASEQTDLTAGDTQRMIGTGALWERLVKYREAGYLMGCGSPAGQDTNVSDEGIVQGHAYALLDVQEIDGNRVLRLRNPWGRVEWNGDWSDEWEGWTARWKSKLGYVNADDGSFWMSFDDWTEHFRNLYVCRLFSESWHSVRVVGEWRGETAGGCPSKKNADTAPHNPQFVLKLTRPTHCFLTLAQDDTRGTGRSEFHLAFFVLRKEGYRAATIRKGEKVGSSGTYINRREVSAEMFLEPAAKPFTVLVSTYNPGEETGFQLTLHSDYPAVLEPLTDDVEAT